jgi:acyl-coenzyme A thioesterase PaaI-like protein
VLPVTHLTIDRRLVGEPVELGPGTASVALVTVAEMAADERGLVHGGFVFGLADYAAMLAINHPNVVLGCAETRFVKPVTVGETLLARANVLSTSGRKSQVKVEVVSGNETVMTGELACFTLDRHVLDPVLNKER